MEWVVGVLVVIAVAAGVIGVTQRYGKPSKWDDSDGSDDSDPWRLT